MFEKTWEIFSKIFERTEEILSNMFDKDVGKSLVKCLRNMGNSHRICHMRETIAYYFVSGNWVMSSLFYKTFICQFSLVNT